jgi:hypothetical protein
MSDETCGVVVASIRDFTERYFNEVQPETYDNYRCWRKPKHTGMHQHKDEQGRRTEWTGGTK